MVKTLNISYDTPNSRIVNPQLGFLGIAITKKEREEKARLKALKKEAKAEAIKTRALTKLELAKQGVDTTFGGVLKNIVGSVAGAIGGGGSQSSDNGDLGAVLGSVLANQNNAQNQPKDNTIMIVGIIGGVLLLVGIVVVSMRKKA